MPNSEKEGAKTVGFSRIGNENEVTGSTPKTIKDDSQTMKTSFTERFAAIVELRSKDKEEAITGTDKSKIFGTLSAITTEAGKQIAERTAAHSARPVIESKVPPVELGDLMLKLEQMVKELKSSEEERQEMRREVRQIKNENLDNYFTSARATEEKLLQVAERVETTDKEREKFIKRDMEEKEKRYEIVNEKLWSLEKGMDTMSTDQAESSRAIQSKLDALSRNSITQNSTRENGESTWTKGGHGGTKPQEARIYFIAPDAQQHKI